MKKFITMLALAIITAQSQAAAPSINIGNLYDYMEGSQKTQLKRVYNGGDATAFVRVTVNEIVYDANNVATEIDAGEVMASTKADTLIVSPARLIIPAQGVQSARLLFMGNRDKERYFRVRYVPVLPEAGDAFNVSEAEAQAYAETVSAGVNLLAGYGTIVFVHPEKSEFDTQVVQKDDSFTIINNGNTSIVLDFVTDCTPNGLECERPTKVHIRPGKQHLFDKKAGRLHKMELLEGDKSRKIEVKG